MPRDTKPHVHIKCPAGAYAGPGERIVEFGAVVGGELQGGLLSLKARLDGALVVEVYRCDPMVEVRGLHPRRTAKAVAACEALIRGDDLQAAIDLAREALGMES